MASLPLCDYSHSLCSRETNLVVLVWKRRSNVNVSRSAYEISVPSLYAVCFERKKTSASEVPCSSWGPPQYSHPNAGCTSENLENPQCGLSDARRSSFDILNLNNTLFITRPTGRLVKQVRRFQNLAHCEAYTNIAAPCCGMMFFLFPIRLLKAKGCWFALK